MPPAYSPVKVAAKDLAADLSLKGDVFVIRPLAKHLLEMGFVALDDLAALRFSSEKTMGALAAPSSAPPTSDFFPYVDPNAVKYRCIDDDYMHAMVMPSLLLSFNPARRYRGRGKALSTVQRELPPGSDDQAGAPSAVSDEVLERRIIFRLSPPLPAPSPSARCDTSRI